MKHKKKELLQFFNAIKMKKKNEFF